MTLLLLVVGLVLWLATAGTLAHVGEILALIGVVLGGIQAALFLTFATFAIRTGRSYRQRFF